MIVWKHIMINNTVEVSKLIELLMFFNSWKTYAFRYLDTLGLALGCSADKGWWINGKGKLIMLVGLLDQPMTNPTTALRLAADLLFAARSSPYQLTPSQSIRTWPACPVRSGRPGCWRPACQSAQGSCPGLPSWGTASLQVHHRWYPISQLSLPSNTLWQHCLCIGLHKRICMHWFACKSSYAVPTHLRFLNHQLGLSNKLNLIKESTHDSIPFHAPTPTLSLYRLGIKTLHTRGQWLLQLH